MDKEKELSQALSFLASNWRHNPTLRAAFEAIFDKLNAGSSSDKENAEILRNYLEFPGSLEALNAAMSLKDSLKTQQGRKAAGVSRRGRGKLSEPSLVTIKDKLMQVMIEHELGKVSANKVDREAIAFLGEDMGDATRKNFIKALRPKAIAYADFYRRLNDAYSKRGSIFDT